MAITNGSINIYTPRTQQSAFEKRMPVTTALRDLFFPTVQTFMTEDIDMDYAKGGYSVAPFVAPNVGGINVSRSGYSTKRYTPPRVAPQRPMSKEILAPRLPGEDIHTAMSPEDRQDYFIQKDAQELDDSITRREELMCSQLLTNGIISVRGYVDDKKENYIDDNIDFQFTNKTTLAGADIWTADTSDKYRDLEDAVISVREAGYNPKYCFLGKSAWKNFKTDVSIMNMLDVRRFELGVLNPQLKLQNGNGLAYMGELSELGIELWTYFAWYLNDSGVLTPIFPDDHVVIAPEAIGQMCYGAITQLEKDERYHTYEGTRVPKIMANINDDVVTTRLSSRPLPKPFDVDSWAVLDVL
jgi:hypothetical protein